MPSSSLSCPAIPTTRTRRPFALRAGFVVIGVSLGALTALAATGAAALLMREASAAEPPKPAPVFPRPAPVRARIGDAPATTWPGGRGSDLTDDDASPKARRSKSRLRDADSALMKRASAETASTLDALLAADNRAQASKR